MIKSPQGRFSTDFALSGLPAQSQILAVVNDRTVFLLLLAILVCRAVECVWQSRVRSSPLPASLQRLHPMPRSSFACRLSLRTSRVQGDAGRWAAREDA